MQNEKPAMEVLPERKQIVSSLDQPMSDVYFMEEYGKKARNMGFHSLASNGCTYNAQYAESCSGQDYCS